MVTIGTVDELRAESVDECAIKQLRRRLKKQHAGIDSDRRGCGAEIVAKIADPGTFLTRNDTCADVQLTCDTPSDARSRERLVSFVPGSLVFCQLNSEDPMRWPAMVEDSPDGPRSFMIPGPIPNIPEAYFVTYIFPAVADRKWVGGFLPAGELHPFKKTRPPVNSTDTYKASLERANQALSYDLPRRLEEFSFVAHVARSRNVHVHGQNPTIREGGWQSEPAEGAEEDEASSTLRQKPGPNSSGSRPLGHVEEKRTSATPVSDLKHGSSSFVSRLVLVPESDGSE